MKKIVVGAVIALIAATSVAATTTPASAMGGREVAIFLADHALDAWINEQTGGNDCQCSSMGDVNVTVEVNVKIVNINGTVHGNVYIQ